MAFVGKRVLVTGGGKGLGLSIVKMFHEEGATVFALDIDKQAIDKVEKQLKGVRGIEANLENWDETKKIVSSILPIHHLVNNAVLPIMNHFENITEIDLQRCLDVNFKAVVNVSQVVTKNLNDSQTQGGTIVNISSMASKLAFSRGAIYSSLKSGIDMLTKSMALELGEFGIRVNSICPSAMWTESLAAAPQEHKDAAAASLQRAPIKRFLQTNEAASLVIFLSSPLAQMLTGEQFFIDGGYTIA